MIRAVLRDGIIYPVDPVPAEWAEGQPLSVEQMAQMDDDAPEDPEELKRWYEDLKSTLDTLDDPEDHKRIQAAMEEADRSAKEWVRREMGLQPE